MGYYSEAVLGTSGLLSYWKLDETSGTTAVDAKGSESLTYAGATLNQAARMGALGPCVLFSKTSLPSDAAKQYAQGVSEPNYTANWTWECWAFLNSYNTTATVSSIGAMGTANYWGRLLRVDQNGALTAGYQETPPQTSSGFPNGTVSHVFTGSAGDVPLSTWFHLAWTYDNTSKVSVKYKNGVAIATSAAQTGSPDTTYLVNRVAQNSTTATGDSGPAEASLCGRFNVTNDWALDGKLMHYAIYNRALSASELLSHYNTGAADFGLPHVPVLQTAVSRAGSW